MERDAEVTKVIFKKAYDRQRKEWYIVAFFPDGTANPGRFMSYEHDGQHGEASYEFYLSCRQATPREYTPLKRELEHCFGYRFRVMKRITRKDAERAWYGRREI